MCHHHHNNEPEFDALTEARAGKFPGTLKPVKVSPETVVGDLLAEVQLSREGYDLRLNGTPTSLEDRVEPGDTVYLIKPIKGN